MRTDGVIAVEPSILLYQARVQCACSPEDTLHTEYVKDGNLPYYFSCPTCGQQYVMRLSLEVTRVGEVRG